MFDSKRRHKIEKTSQKEPPSRRKYLNIQKTTQNTTKRFPVGFSHKCHKRTGGREQVGRGREKWIRRNQFTTRNCSLCSWLWTKPFRVFCLQSLRLPLLLSISILPPSSHPLSPDTILSKNGSFLAPEPNLEQSFSIAQS